MPVLLHFLLPFIGLRPKILPWNQSKNLPGGGLIGFVGLLGFIGGLLGLLLGGFICGHVACGLVFL